MIVCHSQGSASGGEDHKEAVRGWDVGTPWGEMMTLEGGKQKRGEKRFKQCNFWLLHVCGNNKSVRMNIAPMFKVCVIPDRTHVDTVSPAVGPSSTYFEKNTRFTQHTLRDSLPSVCCNK